MTKMVRARIKPELLIWARQSLHLQIAEAAKKIGVPEGCLLKWEQGERAPTIRQLRTAARVYKRPMAVFYLPEPPSDFDALRDFRRLPDTISREPSPALTMAIRAAHQQREDALALYDLLDLSPPTLPAIRKRGIPAEALAENAREILGVDLATQFGWRDRYKALSAWTTALEQAGILVFQAGGVRIEEMRAFSMGARPLPVITANAQDSPRGRVFSIIHEFGHILKDATGLCDLHEDPSDASAEQGMETFCNGFAAALLVPTAALLSEKQVISTKTPEAWSDDVIWELSVKYSVSREVILRRLLTLQRTSQRFYERKRREFLHIYKRFRDQKQQGFVPYYRRIISKLGKAYVRLTLEAYHRETITSADLSDLLGVRLKHIPDIENEVVPRPG